MLRYFKWLLLLKLVTTVCFLSSCGKGKHYGQTAAYPERVMDGNVVLVRKGGEYAAFVLTEQGDDDRVSYHWYMLPTGKNVFSESDRSLKSGKVSKARRIKFGDFDVEWSIARPGEGYVYYGVLPTEKNREQPFELLVTDLTSVEGLDVTQYEKEFTGIGKVRKPEQFNLP